MFTKVKVEFDVAEDALLVPQRCVKELQGQYSVYTVGADNIVQAKTVNAANRIGDLWLIKEGLEPNDRVIIDGMQKVASGSVISPVLTEFVSKTDKEQ